MASVGCLGVLSTTQYIFGKDCLLPVPREPQTAVTWTPDQRGDRKPTEPDVDVKIDEEDVEHYANCHVPAETDANKEWAKFIRSLGPFIDDYGG